MSGFGVTFRDESLWKGRLGIGNHGITARDFLYSIIITKQQTPVRANKGIESRKE